jgi:hypothetical protein
MRRMKPAFCTAVAALAILSASTSTAQTAQPCDRACLLAIADAYFAALVAHDPAKAPMASSAKFTEQTQVLKVGDGLWKTTTEGPTTFKIPVADPVAGQIGVIAMVKASVPTPQARAGGPPPPPPPYAVQLALRLKVENRRITEAEHIYATIVAPNQVGNLHTPRAPLLADAAPADRIPRDLMLLIGNSYYDALMQSDGAVSPFAADCGRRENGMHTAGVGGPERPTPPPGIAPPPGGFRIQGCAEQLDSRAMSYITSIDLRRVKIADEQKGLVFGLTMFRHPMTEKSVTIINKDGTTREQPMNFNPFDLAAAHIFKISSGKIHEIEAMGFTLPLYSKNGWSPFLR